MTLVLGSDIAGFKLLEGPYVNGAYGLVFKAQDNTSSELVALKLSRDPSDVKNLERFKREIELLHELHTHENIVAPKSDLLIDGQYHLYAMEFLEYDLEQILVAIQSDDPEVKLEIFKRICDGLKHAHGKRIYHRDLHHNNVRFGSNKQIPKITDFGKGKALDLPDLSSQPFYEWGWLVQPPEVRLRITDQPTEDDFSTGDMYSLGLLLFTFFNSPPMFYKQLLCGDIDRYVFLLNPTDPMSYYQLDENARKTHYDVWLTQYNRNIHNLLSVQLTDIDLAEKLTERVRKMCNPDRQLRYQSIDEIIIDIGSLL